MTGKIIKISGPVVIARGVESAKVNDIVKVGNEELLGEIIEIVNDDSTIQVYEETDNLKPEEPVKNTCQPLSVELGPGLLTTVYDGIQRPLYAIKEKVGNFISRGITVSALDEEKKWEFIPTIKNDSIVSEGQIIGTVKETSLIVHKIMIPIGISGKINGLKKGKYTVNEAVAHIGKTPIFMKQKWPVKKPRPYIKKESKNVPLITGQRIYDFFFPPVKGGQCAIPGPFGCGKTVTQQAIAKWCDAQIIVYVGCGERGNEMTEVLREFPELKDPKSGKPLMDRTILIANTSNMPVAAREASVYTGITIAEYYRDQGYDVALMADSTSRWAEAMREISGRLEEMPGEEGYPAYLATRLAQFYERAGSVKTLSGNDGSVTVIGAVSPAGGDFSEPVTQNTLKIVKVFWALDSSLAAKRHYWAINWLQSYSLYAEETDHWFNENVDKNWSSYRIETMRLLQKEAELNEIAQLVGKDSLPQEEQFILLVAKIIREDVLQQNAYDEQDMYCPVKKQFMIIQNVIEFYKAGLKIVSAEKKTVNDIENSKLIQSMAQMKYCDNDKFTEILSKTHKEIKDYFKE